MTEEEILTIIRDVGRCMCPFTPGCALEGWKPNNKLGVNGTHLFYCPFGIIQTIARAKKKKEDKWITEKAKQEDGCDVSAGTEEKS